MLPMGSAFEAPVASRIANAVLKISLGPSAAWVLVVLLTLIAAAFGLELPGPPWQLEGWFR